MYVYQKKIERKKEVERRTIEGDDFTIATILSLCKKATGFEIAVDDSKLLFQGRAWTTYENKSLLYSLVFWGFFLVFLM